MVAQERDETAGAGEVLIEVKGCGVCHTDLGYYYDGVPTRHPFPLTLGHEVSGTVVEAGAGAERWIGRSVIVPAVIPCGVCEACTSGNGRICPKQIFPGCDVHGGFASHLRVPARGLCPVPDLSDGGKNPAGLDLSELSVIADAVSTPYQAILRSGLQRGDLAVFVGVGGVGGFGVQIAAARGATVEAGAPDFSFRLDQKHELWADNADELYAQAVAAQWNADQAIDWGAPFRLADEVEDAVAQVMTYMIENENAALVVPARFLGQLHPHFREVQAVLAIQVADEARHIDVFTRRLRLRGREPALSTAGGQASLKTLLDEPDFSVAAFLLSVLGEGTFVSLLNFLHAHAPDPVTRQIARLAARDEGRHVAFGMAHLLRRLELEPELRSRLAHAVQARNDALSGTSGLNEEVFDALILLAAGEFTPAAISGGYARVQALMNDMAEGRLARLLRLGFDAQTARSLAAQHTRNFM